MTITMHDSHITTFSQLEEVMDSAVSPSFAFASHREAYAWMNEVLDRFAYHKKARTKKEKMLVRSYLKRYTAYSKAQLTRLAKEKKKKGTLIYGKGRQRHRFPKVYTKKDAELLADADNAYRRMSGDAMRATFKDEYGLYGKEEYVRLAKISHGQFYRLRGTAAYREHSLTIAGTKAVSAAIGVRKKPQTDGKPGHIRADTVHQGDLDGVKGVYHINLVDEVTQWEIVICVEDITEGTMARVLMEALKEFPFVILGFHSDNGSENINGSVAAVLQKLLIEQTKSRSGKCNDNALIEGKNGAVIRKHMGHWHIPRYEARKIEVFYREWFNEFLQYHRMCAYPTMFVAENGKKKRIYEETMTPCQKLLSLPEVEHYLKPGVTVASLKEKSMRMSHVEYAVLMHEAKQKLLAAIKRC